jgi:hypothetical protein
MKNVWMGVLAGLAGTVYVTYMLITSKGSLSQIIGIVLIFIFHDICFFGVPWLLPDINYVNHDEQLTSLG